MAIGKIVTGFHLNQFIHIPGFGYVANHPKTLTPEHVAALKGMGQKMEDTVYKVDPPAEMYVTPGDSSPRTEPKPIVNAPAPSASK